MSKRPSMSGGDDESISSSRRQSTLHPIPNTLRRGTLMGRKSMHMSRPSIGMGSIAGGGHKRKLENTYRLEAKEDERFRTKTVENILRSTLESYLANEAYEAKKCVVLTKNITDIIRNKMKEIEALRFKIVCIVYIGQKTRGGVSFSSRAMWMPESGDNFAEVRFENSTLYAIATVYGLYYE